MIWLLVFLTVCACAAIFVWSYKRHLDVLTGPWITR
jgi:hypothetical protein